jgi:tripartite-type tricarboxylate transporter receptor subunit TctC
VREAIRLALNKEVSLAINAPDARDKIATDGAEPAPPHTPAQFRAQYLEQYDQLSKFIKTSGIKVE